MKIYYFKTKYGYNIETHIDYCCDKMKSFYDLRHRSQFGIALGHHSGIVRLFGRYKIDVDEYEHRDISYCPFCGERIVTLKN